MRDPTTPLQDQLDTYRRDIARHERRFDALIDELRFLKQAGPDADPDGTRRWTLLAELGLVIGALCDLAREERSLTE